MIMDLNMNLPQLTTGTRVFLDALIFSFRLKPAISSVPVAGETIPCDFCC